MAKRKTKTAPTVEDSLRAFAKGLDKALDVAETNPDALPGHARTVGNPITLGPRVADAEEWAAKQLTNAAAAGDRWLERVQRPRKNPVEAARAAAGKWKNKIQEAVANDAFGKGLAKVDVDEMYRTIAKRGAAAFTAGVGDREEKVKRVVGEVRDQVVALATELDKMPVDTDAQREAKMLAAKRGMQAIGKRRKGIK
jgi:hypothetical protein